MSREHASKKAGSTRAGFKKGRGECESHPQAVHQSKGRANPVPRSRKDCGEPYAFLFALTFAHRARCATAIFLRTAADITCFGFAALVAPLDAACFAHRAFCARLIFLRAAAETLDRGSV
jgi:hypothetical protein